MRIRRTDGPSAGIPEESAGLEPIGAGSLVIGSIRGVNDRWAHLVDGFLPTEYELVVLATHYLDRMMEIRLIGRCYQQYGSDWRMEAFADRRLGTIEQGLGGEKFEAAIAKSLAKWRQKFADVDKEEASLAPCTACGGKRFLYDADCSSTSGGLCGACVPDPKAALGLCASCGRARELTGSAYTGNLCWDCASERLAPCATCGGKRLLGPNESALCDECLRATVPPCKYCGAKRHPVTVSPENDHGYCGSCTW
jgi:hypothetical protein